MDRVHGHHGQAVAVHDAEREVPEGGRAGRSHPSRQGHAQVATRPAQRQARPLKSHARHPVQTKMTNNTKRRGRIAPSADDERSNKNS